MNKELKKAFKETIERWEKIVEDVSYYARSECPLCMYAEEIRGYYKSKCPACPIGEKTGGTCGGTPWIEFMYNRTTENALRELVFLKNLYIELIDCPIPCPKPTVPLEDNWQWVKIKGEWKPEKKRARKEEWVDITKDVNFTFRTDKVFRMTYKGVLFGHMRHWGSFYIVHEREYKAETMGAGFKIFKKETK